MVMESNIVQKAAEEEEEEDRLSVLTDDILLSILGRVDLATAARTSALSRRWRNLPWLLPHLNLHVRDFLPSAPCPDHPIQAAQLMDQAMASLTKATGSFLAHPCTAVTTRLSLKLYMDGNYSRDIGPLVSHAIDTGMVKDLDLAILDEKEPDCPDEDMLQRARDVDAFFSAYPSLLHCLTRLHLHNARFAASDIHRLLFECRNQLQHLSLDQCDTGNCSVWQINAPNSNLRVLQVYYSCLKRIEVLCLPKLEQLHWVTWFYYEAPLCFGYVPSLKELGLLCAATLDHRDFSLSEVLHGATNIHTLILNFQGQKLWMQPEGKQLRTAFSKLRKLSIHGIFVEFDLLWTINLLEAAPSVETFDVEIYEHPCQEGDERRIRWFGDQRVKPSWKMPSFTPNRWQLKELQLFGFRPLLEQHMLFVSAVMDRAPNLKTVLLKEDDEPCKDCEAMVTLPPPIGGMFPRDKDEQEAIANQLRDRVWSSAQIIFSSSDSIVVL